MLPRGGSCQAVDPFALVGPTASGKTSLSLALCRARPRPEIELVSVDSMALYRGMNIGTAKPAAGELGEVRMHLVDMVDPDEEVSLRDFQVWARAALAGIEDRGHRALLVGGTGLYLRAVVDCLELPGRYPVVAASLESEADRRGGLADLYARLQRLDPIAASRMEPGNRRRVIRALEVTIGSGRPFSSYGPGLGSYPVTRVHMVGIRFDPELHGRLIDERFDAMMDLGLLDEARALARRPGGLSRTARQALGYRELLAYLEGGEGSKAALERAIAEAKRRTKAFAHRQWAWFRRDPRITWLDPRGDLLAQLLQAYDASADAQPARAVPAGGAW